MKSLLVIIVSLAVIISAVSAASLENAERGMTDIDDEKYIELVLRAKASGKPLPSKVWKRSLGR